MDAAKIASSVLSPPCGTATGVVQFSSTDTSSTRWSIKEATGSYLVSSGGKQRLAAAGAADRPLVGVSQRNTVSCCFLFVASWRSLLYVHIPELLRFSPCMRGSSHFATTVFCFECVQGRHDLTVINKWGACGPKYLDISVLRLVASLEIPFLARFHHTFFFRSSFVLDF